MAMKQKQQPLAISPEAIPYLRTLRRIPEDIRLSMMTRGMFMHSWNSCLCGWAIREAIFSRVGDAPQERSITVEAEDEWYDMGASEIAHPVVAETKRLFGGRSNEWTAIFCGVVDKDAALIEEAFTIATQEAAEGRQLVSIP
jgi:hypothetical protein